VFRLREPVNVLPVRSVDLSLGTYVSRTCKNGLGKTQIAIRLLSTQRWEVLFDFGNLAEFNNKKITTILYTIQTIGANI